MPKAIILCTWKFLYLSYNFKQFIYFNSEVSICFPLPQSVCVCVCARGGKRWLSNWFVSFDYFSIRLIYVKNLFLNLPLFFLSRARFFGLNYKIGKWRIFLLQERMWIKENNYIFLQVFSWINYFLIVKLHDFFSLKTFDWDFYLNILFFV